MANQSVSFDDSVLAWLKAEAVKRGHTFSFIVNFYCQEAMQKAFKERPGLLACVKHPGLTYSSRLDQCPSCAEEQTMRDIDAHDNLVKQKRAELNAEFTRLQNNIDAMATEIRGLDPEAKEGDKIKQDKLLENFDNAVKKRNEISQQLADLN